MAVQAQYPSSILLSDLRKRLSSEMYGVDGGDIKNGLDSSSQGHHHHHHHLLHSFYGASTGTSASNFHQTTPANISCNVTGALDNVPNIIMTRKKLRSSENSIIESNLPPPVHNSTNNNTTSSSMQNPSLIMSSNNNNPIHHHEVLINSADLMNNCRNFLNVQTTTAPPAICFNSSNSNNNMVNIAPRFNNNGFGNLLSRPQQLTAAVSSVTNGNDNFTIPDKSSSIALNNSSSYSSGFQLQYILRQKEDIDQIINLHGDQMKKALERKIQHHSKSLLVLMQKCMESSMREKEIEIEEAKHRNQELEERVKQISLESHLWQNAARHNEAMVNTLRSNLEQILAQSREQQINHLASHGNDNYNMKEGCGETDGGHIDADEHIDAESCVYGEIIRERKDCHNDEDHHNAGNLLLKESIMTGKHPCRFCKKNEVCILLLPCRHLCLCKECDIRFAHNCPICGCTKNASMRVYLD